MRDYTILPKNIKELHRRVWVKLTQNKLRGDVSSVQGLQNKYEVLELEIKTYVGPCFLEMPRLRNNKTCNYTPRGSLAPYKVRFLG